MYPVSLSGHCRSIRSSFGYVLKQLVVDHQEIKIKRQECNSKELYANRTHGGDKVGIITSDLVEEWVQSCEGERLPFGQKETRSFLYGKKFRYAKETRRNSNIELIKFHMHRRT